MWKEPWVPWLLGFLPRSRSPSFAPTNCKVSQLILLHPRRWNVDLINDLFAPDSAEAILKIVLLAFPKSDKLVWIIDPKGNFLVKSTVAINHTHDDRVDDVNWKSFWKLRIHERYKILIWRIGNGILPTKLNIALRLGFSDNLCPLCKLEEESIDHLFLKCSISRAI